ncbi:MAG TPA: DUF2752 domain-containing protein [Nitrospirota bacterium]|nr:DUF2752 domain-containing protein [Nitrospirota bacterium]
MQVTFSKRSTGQIEFGIIYGSMACLVIGAARVLPILSIAPSCVFKNITGIPCPTCGTTRSVVYLAQGKIATAYAMNPLAATVLIAAVLYFFYSVITLIFNLPRLGFILNHREKIAVQTTAIMLLLVQWAYLISSR